jgi:hypothetical protein
MSVVLRHGWPAHTHVNMWGAKEKGRGGGGSCAAAASHIAVWCRIAREMLSRQDGHGQIGHRSAACFLSPGGRQDESVPVMSEGR